MDTEVAVAYNCLHALAALGGGPEEADAVRRLVSVILAGLRQPR